MYEIENDGAPETNRFNAVELASELTMAWLSNPNTRASAEDVPDFLKSMHSAVADLVRSAGPSSTPAPAEAAPEYVPAVGVRKSLSSKEHIISMIDGKPYRTMRRHLATHGLTPEQYRERYNLKPDYPMVAETYSEQRRALAKKIGLGRKPVEKAPAKKAPAKAAPAKRATRKRPAGDA